HALEADVLARHRDEVGGFPHPRHVLLEDPHPGEGSAARQARRTGRVHRLPPRSGGALGRSGGRTVTGAVAAAAAPQAVPPGPPPAPRTAWAAASRAIGTRNGEQLT